MSIELTADQQQALDGGREEPPRVVDPRTHETYVLLRADVYEKVRALIPPSTPGLRIAPGIRRSKEAFLRDLPQLLAKPRHHGWWVAYHGDECLGPARNGEQLLRECERRGVPPDESYFAIVRPHEPEPEEVEPRHSHHFADLEPEP